MEQRHVQGLAEYMLTTHFHTKRCMAESLNVPYRALLRVFAARGSVKEHRSILDAILHYSVHNLICLEGALNNL